MVTTLPPRQVEQFQPELVVKCEPLPPLPEVELHFYHLYREMIATQYQYNTCRKIHNDLVDAIKKREAQS